MGKNYDKYCRFVFVCGGKDCKKNGSKEVQKALGKEVRSHGLKDEVKVIKTKCTGRCKEGPILIAKDRLWIKTHPNDTVQIIESLKLKDTAKHS